MGATQSSQNSKLKRSFSRSSLHSKLRNHEPLFTSISNKYDAEQKRPPKSREQPLQPSTSTFNPKKLTRRKRKDTISSNDGDSKKSTSTKLSLSPTLTAEETKEQKIKYNKDTIEFYGRSYAAAGNHKYIMPIDDQEQDRLVQVHFIYKYLFNGNFSAPVKDLLSVNLSLSSSLTSQRGTSTGLHLRRCSTGGGPANGCSSTINIKSLDNSGISCINHRYNFMMYTNNPQSQPRNSYSSSCTSSNLLPNADWLYDTSPKVLDIACGNGTWIMEMATDFPESQFFGIDINSKYPSTIKPPNTNFFQWDILHPKGVPFPDEFFDYIFMRQVYTCFSSEDWVTVMKEVKRLLKPGGYVEFRDLDPLIRNQGPLTTKLSENFPKLMEENYKVNVKWAKHMIDILYDVGNMTDVHQQTLPLRFAALPSTDPVGHMILRSLRLGLENYRLFYEKHQNVRKDMDFLSAVDMMLKEAVDYNAYMEYVCCWARKPLFDTTDMTHTNARRYSSGLLILNKLHNNHHNTNKAILHDLRNKRKSKDGDDLNDSGIIHEENVTDINQFVEGFYED